MQLDYSFEQFNKSYFVTGAPQKNQNCHSGGALSFSAIILLFIFFFFAVYTCMLQVKFVLSLNEYSL